MSECVYAMCGRKGGGGGGGGGGGRKHCSRYIMWLVPMSDIENTNGEGGRENVQVPMAS